VPEADADHAPYTKRAMAAVMVEAMEALGFVRFRLAGHDRGGRVGYRLALDHPGRLEQLAVLDIITTWDMWHRFDARLAMRAWHWTFLALPAPFPETLIGHDPAFFFDSRARAGAKAKDAAIFDPRALAHYHAAYQDPLRIHAMCEDYRAGRTTDLAHDEADRAAGKTIGCPVLALWGSGGLPANAGIDPLAAWRDWAPDLRGFAIESGHYMPEENPAATARALLDFFSAR
jgi:haloacetate dehalogenase